MNPPLERSPGKRSPLGSPGALYVGFAVALCAVPLVALGRIDLLGYDAWWHVFIARQEVWDKFWAEIGRTAHPPVFFLCLKAAIAAFGAGPLAYRLVSIAATVGSIWLVGRILRRTAGHPWVPAAGALAFGASLSTFSVGLEVRPYALGTFFLLCAFLALLELVEHGFCGPLQRPRVLFALTSSLALLTHYGTSLFLPSCLVAAAAPAVVDREYRRRLLAAARRHRPANLLTFGTPAAVLAIAYFVHIASWAERSFHSLRSFLFDPDREGVLTFLWRNTRALFGLFVPRLDYPIFHSLRFAGGPELPGAVVAVLLAGSVAALAWLAWRRFPGDGAAGVTRRVPAILLPTMTALIVVLGLLGRYPYGGRLRHQYFLFPFAVIVLALLVDALARGSRRRTAGLIVCLFALAGLLNGANWIRQGRLTPVDPHRVLMKRFYRNFPAPEVIYADQFNLIHLFRHHHDRRWRFERRVRSHGLVEVWRVGGDGGREFVVCRDVRQWQLDLSNEFTYLRLLSCLDAAEEPRAVIFRQGYAEGRVQWPIERTEELVREAAEAAGLTVESVIVGQGKIYAELARR